MSNFNALYVELSNSNALNVELSNSSALNVKLSNLGALNVKLSNSSALHQELFGFHHYLANTLAHVIGRFIHPSNIHLSIILDAL